MILIISEISDLQVYWVTHFLNKWRIPHKLFCPSRFPQELSQQTYLSDRSSSELWILDDGSALNPGDVTSVWYRKPSIPQLSPDLGASEKEYALNECRQALFGLYNCISNAFWVSNVHKIRIAANKPMQLGLAKSFGLKIPETLITNKPDEAKRFAARHPGGIIYKSLSDGILYTREGPWQEPFVQGEIYSSRLDSLSDDQLLYVRTCPCLLQEYIEKTYEVRVTVVHDEVFSVAIHSQESVTSQIDWRKANMKHIRHSKHKLPRGISDKCVSLTSQLGLQFGAIDLIYTPHGDYVFLEINPNGQFGWLEETIGPCISEKIAAILANPPNTRSLN